MSGRSMRIVQTSGWTPSSARKPATRSGSGWIQRSRSLRADAAFGTSAASAGSRTDATAKPSFSVRSFTRAPHTSGREEGRPRPHHDTRAIGASALLGMGALASGPFLDLLARHPEFWIAHDLSPAEAVGVA